MNKEEIIYFIRDSMLVNPNIDADFVYKVANIALIDSYMYDLMEEWMEETYDPNKMFIEWEMEEYFNGL